MWMRQATPWFALGLLLATASPAQIGGTGVAAGVLVDPSDAPVVGAEVRLVSAQGERSEFTSPAGEFRFDGLQPGDYRLQVPQMASEKTAELQHSQEFVKKVDTAEVRQARMVTGNREVSR
jgi:hypothetical protein